MIVAPPPPDEIGRIAELRSLRLLDTPPEERFDRISQLAAHFFDVPIAYVALVDSHRQWFKSRVGLDACETGRDVSFCSHTILLDEPLVIPDAALDPRFAANPLVTGGPRIRFYAGVPLKGPSGKKVGTFCISDTRPRAFGDDDVRMLSTLAALVERELKLSDVIELQCELLRVKNALEQELAEASAYVRSLLPAPVAEGPVRVSWSFLPSSQLGGDAFGYRWLDENRFALYLLDVSGHGIGAAMLTMGILNWLHHAATEGEVGCPSELITRLNASFPMETHGGKFFTMWYGVYDKRDRRLAYCNAGHPPPVLSSTKPGDIRRLDAGGPAVGVIGGIAYERGTATLEPASRLALFSDGLFEITRDDGQMFTYDDFFKMAERMIPRTEAPNPDRIVGMVKQLKGNNVFHDDVSLVLAIFA